MSAAVTLDWTVHFDAILAILAMIGSAGVIWGALRADLKTLNAKVAQIESAISRQTTMLIDMARQDQKLQDHERRLDVLER